MSTTTDWQEKAAELYHRFREDDLSESPLWVRILVNPARISVRAYEEFFKDKCLQRASALAFASLLALQSSALPSNFESREPRSLPGDHALSFSLSMLNPASGSCGTHSKFRPRRNATVLLRQCLASSSACPRPIHLRLCQRSPNQN